MQVRRPGVRGPSGAPREPVLLSVENVTGVAARARPQGGSRWQRTPSRRCRNGLGGAPAKGGGGAPKGASFLYQPVLPT